MVHSVQYFISLYSVCETFVKYKSSLNQYDFKLCYVSNVYETLPNLFADINGLKQLPEGQSG